MKNAWIITDGKAGDLAQCLGIVEYLKIPYEIKTTHPRNFWSLWMPYGPPDPHEHPSNMSSPFKPPFPTIIIASGRRAIPIAKAIKEQAPHHVFSVILKDPRTPFSSADFIWVPNHDALRGVHILHTLTGPHKQTQYSIKQKRNNPAPHLSALPSPRIAVMLGGPNKQFPFTKVDQTKIIAALEVLQEQGASLMITPSRRTPQTLLLRLSELSTNNCYIYDGVSPNPYQDMLALADGFFITSDSANMLSEACATGKGIMLFRLEGKPGKFEKFFDGLMAASLAREFVGELELFSYPPVDTTPLIGEAIQKAYEKWFART